MQRSPALALFTFLCRLRSLRDNDLGPAGGMALAEALKGNTTLTSLRSAALPSRTHSPVRHGRTACTFAALALFTLLFRVRSLWGNGLGPAAGMALAEALKGNTALKSLRSAAPPSRTHPPVRHGRTACTLAALALYTFLSRVRSLAVNELGPAAGMALAEALKGNTTLTYLQSAALPSNPLARASRALTSIHHSVHFTPAFPSSDASQHRPARAVNATSHSLR
eukprot:scaffold99910_cov60-Phaeocystis_antarctica.AAC.1